MQEPEIGKQVDDLLLAEVAAARGPVGRQPFLAERLLVALGLRSGHEEEHDLAGRRLAGVHELPDPPREVPRLGDAPVDVRAPVGRLVGDEELDARAEERLREPAGGDERLEVAAELRPEDVVHDGEHLGP